MGSGYSSHGEWVQFTWGVDTVHMGSGYSSHGEWIQFTWGVGTVHMGSGYSSHAENLIKFNELEQLPGTLKLERLKDGHGNEAAMVANNAQYHHTCRAFAGSNTTIQNCKQQKSENSRQKARAMMYQLHANAAGRINAHQGWRIWPKKLASSADNLLGPTVFIKQRMYSRVLYLSPYQKFISDV